MTEVSSSTTLPIAAEKVWEMIRGFGQIGDWHPAVESCTLEEGGTVRRMKIPGGGEIVESLERHEDDQMTFTYKIVSSPLPVANYESTVRVVPDGDGCKIHWTGQFDAVGPEDKASKIVKGIYDGGFEGIKKAWGIS
ncbi:MAG: SRPBCC family protein [Alphaproteobacteria bacterium]